VGGRALEAEDGRPALSMARPPAANGRHDPEAAARSQMEGLGNTAIALKLSRHVVLRDFSISRAATSPSWPPAWDDSPSTTWRIDPTADGLGHRCMSGRAHLNTSCQRDNDDAIV
jgi:hypothetical protein